MQEVKCRSKCRKGSAERRKQEVKCRGGVLNSVMQKSECRIVQKSECRK